MSEIKREFHIGDAEWSEFDYGFPVKVRATKRKVVRVITDPITKEKIPEYDVVQKKEVVVHTLQEFLDLIGVTELNAKIGELEVLVSQLQGLEKVSKKVK